MYTQVEFWGVTQELGQHDGQTLPNRGKNQIHMRFGRISKTIASHSGGKYQIHMNFARMSKTIL